jgi:hypothetical protein
MGGELLSSGFERHERRRRRMTRASKQPFMVLVNRGAAPRRGREGRPACHGRLGEYRAGLGDLERHRSSVGEPPSNLTDGFQVLPSRLCNSRILRTASTRIIRTSQGFYVGVSRRLRIHRRLLRSCHLRLSVEAPRDHVGPIADIRTPWSASDDHEGSDAIGMELP